MITYLSLRWGPTLDEGFVRTGPVPIHGLQVGEITSTQ